MDYKQLEKHFADYIINLLGPNEELDSQREKKFNSLRGIIIGSFMQEIGIIPHVFCFGSFPLKTYLQESDLDITIILEDKLKGTMLSNYSYDYLNKIMILIQNGLEAYNQEVGTNVITDINLIFADVKLIKCKFENLPIDISINNLVGLCKLLFFAHLEKNYLDAYLFKRSILLIKSWCYYEGCILGSNICLLASYALEILVVYMFNNYRNTFETDVEAFFQFFKIISSFDWDKNIVTVFGFISSENFYEKLNKNNFSVDSLVLEENKASSSNTTENKSEIKDVNTSNNSQNKPYLINIDDIASLKKEFDRFKDFDKIQNFNSNKKAINLKYMNIVDPIFPTNNLGKSVNFHNFSKIKKVFEYAAKEVDQIISSRSSTDPYNYLNLLLKLFNKTVTFYNSELFYYTLPQPKIIITPKNMENELNENKNLCNNSSNNDMIKTFNKMFTLSNNNATNTSNVNSLSSSLNNLSINSNNSVSFQSNYATNDVKNNLSNFVWPSNYKIEDNNEKINTINYFKNSNFAFSYATKDILEFVMKNSESYKQYNFQSYQDFSSVELFLKKFNM